MNINKVANMIGKIFHVFIDTTILLGLIAMGVMVIFLAYTFGTWLFANVGSWAVFVFAFIMFMGVVALSR